MEKNGNRKFRVARVTGKIEDHPGNLRPLRLLAGSDDLEKAGEGGAIKLRSKSIGSPDRVDSWPGRCGPRRRDSVREAVSANREGQKVPRLFGGALPGSTE